MRSALFLALLAVAPARNPNIHVERAAYENGQPKYERSYLGDPRDGILHGELREWLPDGTLYREMHYVNGHEAGLQRMWYDDGAVRASYVVHDGRRYGLMGAKGCAGESH
jgi:antitoxin component YwqK of YwqJK toxin-antitoxin module